MHILFDDKVQYSDAPDSIKSPALSETTELFNTVTINFDQPYNINSVGLGNLFFENELESIKINELDGSFAYAVYGNSEVDGGIASTVFTNELDGSDSIKTNVIIYFNDYENTEFKFHYNESGLYLLPKEIIATSMAIKTDAKFIGRIGAGIGCHIPTSIQKSTGFFSTAEPRISLSGQSLMGKGGYNYRVLSIDSRSRIDEFAMSELQKGLKFISQGYPFFLNLDCEKYKLPFDKFYGIEDNQQQISFEGGLRKFLYSKKWDFRECF